jgi:hypothetical protein
MLIEYIIEIMGGLIIDGYLCLASCVCVGVGNSHALVEILGVFLYVAVYGGIWNGGRVMLNC